MANLTRQLRLELNQYDPAWNGFMLFHACTVEEVKEFYISAQKISDNLKAYEQMLQFITNKFVSGELNGETIAKEDLKNLDLSVIQDILELILGAPKKK